MQMLPFIARSVNLAGDTQKVFVIVQDQTLSPLPGAISVVTVHLSTGTELVQPVATDNVV
jgi:hypothetical protein